MSPALLLLSALLLTAGVESATACSSSPAGVAARASKPESFDACSLLTKREIEAVQKSVIQSSKPSTRSGKSFVSSQCFYSATEFPKSVSLMVALPERSKSATGARDFWQETFGRAEQRPDKPTPRSVEEARYQAKKPLRVKGIGDEAYWVGDRVGGGALYVLLGDRFLRISVGGPGDEPAKEQKSLALARRALKRLSAKR